MSLSDEAGGKPAPLQCWTTIRMFSFRATLYASRELADPWALILLGILSERVFIGVLKGDKTWTVDLLSLQSSFAKNSVLISRRCSGGATCL